MDKIVYKRDLSGKFFWMLYSGRRKLYGLTNIVIQLVCKTRGIKIGKNVRFIGFPRIRRHPFSTISIGDNCVFRSSKHSDFFGLVKPCTFVTRSRDAKIIIGNNVKVTGLSIGSASNVQIGNNVMTGAQCTIFDTDFHHPDPNIRLAGDIMPTRPVIIEDNVFLGYNCLILKGTRIGENSVIGANSVVFNNIPSNSIAIGNPCKVIIKKSWYSTKDGGE